MSQAAIPQKTPYVQEMEPGQYAWCSCGKSNKQPFCDGAHQGTDFIPVITKIEEKKTVAWCGCKCSKNPPFCDGVHSQL